MNLCITFWLDESILHPTQIYEQIGQNRIEEEEKRKIENSQIRASWAEMLQCIFLLSDSGLVIFNPFFPDSFA